MPVLSQPRLKYGLGDIGSQRPVPVGSRDEDILLSGGRVPHDLVTALSYLLCFQGFPQFIYQN